MGEGPEHGHLFRFTFTSRGSHRTVGEEGYSESDWWGPEVTFEVRAWSLRAALLKAADMPFPILMGEEPPILLGEEGEDCEG